MTTFNIETAIPTGNLHKRQTGLWGQLLASAEIERKLARVEPLFKELHGRGLNRTAFFKKCREIAREGKADVGGYLQYMAQDAAGIVLERMHKELGKQVRRKKQRDLFIDAGRTEVYNLRELAKSKGGRPKKEVA